MGAEKDLESSLPDPPSSGEPKDQASAPSACSQSPAAQADISADGPSDPKEWSGLRKIIVVLALCFFVLSLTYSSTAYVVSSREIEEHFGVSRLFVTAGVTLYVFAFAAGPLLLGPASDLYGRRPVYVISGLIYSAAAFGAAFAPNAGALLAFRFLSSFFGSSSINNVIASIADITHPLERQKLSAFYALFAFGGPSLGPLCGSFIQQHAGFRWNLRVMAIFATVTSIGAALVPETYPPVLAAKWERRHATNAPAKVPFSKVVSTLKVALSRPLIYLFTEPIAALVCIVLALFYSILYGFFSSFVYVWVTTRGFSLVQYGLTYIALGLGFVVSFFVTAVRGKRYAAKMMKRGDKRAFIPPEQRLEAVIPFAALAPVSLIIFAWTAPYPRVHWIAPCIAEALFGLSMFQVFTSFIPYLAESYAQYAASALAAGMFSRALLAAAFPLFSLQMFEKLTIQGASMLLAALTALLVPVPLFFLKRGAQLREKSRYAVANPESYKA